jgi:putative peptidoglycan lipid II flippase
MRPAARQPASSRTRGGGVGRAVAIVSLLSIVSRVIGIVREVIVARQFGTSGEYDAYLAAFRIPDLLFLLVMTGAFGSAFIPVFTPLLDRDEDAAWRLASAVITWTAAITFVISVMVFVAAGPVVRYLVAPGLDPALQDLSAQVMRILLLSPMLLGMGIAAKGILEAQSRFTLPAIAPLVYNVSIIAGAIVFAPGMGVTGLAVGVVIGGALHFSVQLPGLITSGMRFTPSLDPRVVGLGQVVRLLGPRVIGQAAFAINFIFVTYLASREQEGAVSALNYAFAMMMMPNAAIGGAFATVLFPTMTLLYQRGDLEGLRTTFMNGLRPLVFLLMPISAGLFVFREPVIQVVFQAGAFSEDSTRLVATPLAFFAVSLVFYSLVEVLARAFYSLQDSRTPVIAGLVITVINIGVGLAITPRIGFTGLAIGLCVSTLLEALILIVALSRRLGRFEAAFGGWFARVALATGAMALVGEAVTPRLLELTAPGVLARPVAALFLAYAVGFCAVVYFAVCWLIGVGEVQRWLRLLNRIIAPVVSRVPARRGA